MPLNRVTITGADDNTPVEALNDLAAEFPFVEFGILVSRAREGGIGPNNIVDKICRAESIARVPFWLDMEGQVRDGDNLCLRKVRSVLEACAPSVAPL